MDPKLLTLDYTNMLAEKIGKEHGISGAELDKIGARVKNAHTELNRLRDGGAVGFFDLPKQMLNSADELTEFAGEINRRFKYFVNLGIGGSALGGIAALGAFRHVYANETGGDGLRFFFPDNVDPERMNGLAEAIDPEQTLFSVVSKSGGTAETAAQYLFCRQLIRQSAAEKNWRDHFVFITDKSKGPLRALAEKSGAKSFVIPENVGGRFSVLSPVGLLPMAAAGIDIKKVLSGAADFAAQLESDRIEENPAYMLAALLYLADTEKKKPTHVLMAYADSLYRISDWFRQLWAESLGKKSTGENAGNVGPTPVAALGATDQHSQVQLYMEGPFDKVIVLLGLNKFRNSARIVSGPEDPPEFSYLNGVEFGDLLNAERRGAELALTEAGRPNMSLTIDQLNEQILGALFYLFELATAMAGQLYRVDAYDQPGVELGKKFTFGLMGRKGFEEFVEKAAADTDSAGRKTIES